MEKWYDKTKRLLREAGITNSQVAERLGCTQGSVSQKLNNKRSTYVYEIEIMADMLGVSTAELIDDDAMFARPDERDLLQALRGMDKDERARAYKLIKALSE